MDFLDDALDAKAEAANQADSDGKKAHENSVQFEKWFKALKPAIEQVKQRSGKAPDGTDIESLLAKEFGLKLGGVISFPLRNGDEKEFDIVKISGKGNIESRTFVPKVNGRDQDDLTPESMSDIYSLIAENGQTFPAIGWIPDPESGIIHVLDGSRRRMCCILSDQTFTVYVAKGSLTKPEAKYIADISRLTKDLSYYEEGQALIEIMEDNGFVEVKELAEHLGEGITTLQHKVNAGRLPATLLQAFPSYNSMKTDNYKKLHSLTLKVQKTKISYTDILEAAKSAFTETLTNDSLTTSERYKQLVQNVIDAFDKLNKTVKKEKPQPVSLHNFDNKDKSATILSTKTKTNIVLTRIPKSKVEKIQEFISKTLAEPDV
ncbi:hypothetical protein LCS82_07870 [Vibrio harveyi]|uniref:hypothetical protein n=1 Tax=Vibrio harveyi TaxID=669 RepID=UPI003BB4EAB4